MAIKRTNSKFARAIAPYFIRRSTSNRKNRIRQFYEDSPVNSLEQLRKA
ncbi:hypothetical protein JOY44_09535 [Phormidium sp. CLA17]|nr:hypothetical protein [Leptolyngbya sp. Cla-17]